MNYQYALQEHNKPNDPMSEYYKSCGFKLSWDYDNIYHWDELYLNGKLVLQVEQGITREQFLAAVDGLLMDPDHDISFFMASNLEIPEFNEMLIKYFK